MIFILSFNETFLPRVNLNDFSLVLEPASLYLLGKNGGRPPRAPSVFLLRQGRTLGGCLGFRYPGVNLFLVVGYPRGYQITDIRSGVLLDDLE